MSGGGSNSGGGGYIDELAQIAINHDPTDPTENRCHRFLAALHGVNYNVLGVVADDGGAAGGGVLTERYAYSPYGQRQVFGHGWHFADLNGDGRVDQLDLDLFDSEYFGLQTDDAQPGDLNADGDATIDDRNLISNALGWNHDHDPHLLTPRARSARVEGAGGGVQQPFGLCRIGHQGLAHDEETSLIYNRARMRSVHLGRFLQRDPLGYVDGMSVYAGYHAILQRRDPSGLVTQRFKDNWGHVILIGEMNITLSLSTKPREDRAPASGASISWVAPRNLNRTGQLILNACCKEVRFVQIEKTNFNWIFNSVRNGWQIDGGAGNAYFYPYQHSVWPAFPFSNMTDDPGSGQQRFFVTGKQEFETCAICSGGAMEGYNFGCVRWSHYFRDARAPFEAFGGQFLAGRGPDWQATRSVESGSGKDSHTYNYRKNPRSAKSVSVTGGRGLWPSSTFLRVAAP